MNTTKAITKIEAMHKHFGKKEGFKCGNCCNLIKKQENRTYYKCQVYGCSASIATDWVKKWTACGMFDMKVEQNEHRALSIRQEVEEPIDGQIKIEEVIK
jgi:hypothetical protein